MKERTSPEIDIAKIDNELFRHEALIDGLVFKLFKISEQEANSIMNSLDLLPSYQQLVRLKIS